MSRRLWGITLLGVMCALDASTQSRLTVGEPVPAFTGTRSDGTLFDSSELEGGVVLIDFWGVWCPPCIGAFPKLSRLHQDYASRGFRVLGLAVLSGTPEEVAEFVADYGVNYPIVLVEQDVPESFGVLQYPAYFLVAADGTLERSYPSRPGDLYTEVAADLDRLLPPAPRDEPRTSHLDTPKPPG